MNNNRRAFTRTLTVVVASLSLVSLVNCAKQTTPKAQNPLVSSRGILNGQAVEGENAKTFGPVLGLEINESGLCSASHLGNGYILTAWHCIGLEMQEHNGKKPELIITSPTVDRAIGPVSGDDYDVSFPKAEDYQTASDDTGKQIRVPQPDLSLVHLKGQAAQQLIREAAAVSLPSVELKTGDAGLTISGYGQQGLSDDSAVGSLMEGKANLVEVDDLVYVLDYTPGSEASSALPGDSGGPLFKLGENGIEQYGVASSVALDTDQNDSNTNNNSDSGNNPFPFFAMGQGSSLLSGLPFHLSLKARKPAAPKLKEAYSLYVRIDRAPVHQWLAQELASH